MPGRRVFILANDYWGSYLRHLLVSQDLVAEHISYRSPRTLARIFADPAANLLAVGLAGSPSVKRLTIWAMVFAWWLVRQRRGSITTYWIGSEIPGTSLPGLHRFLLWLLQRAGVRHICGAPWFVDELARSGIGAEHVLFPYDTTAAKAFPQPDLPPSPYRICTYLTSGSWTNAHGDDILRLAAMTAGVEWTVFGMAGNPPPGSARVPGNLRFLGWVDDPQKVLADNHALIRWIDHDAYSGTVRDAQAMGKTVLYTMPVDGVVQIRGRSLEQVAAIIDDLARGNPAPVNAGFVLPPYAQQIEGLKRVLG